MKGGWHEDDKIMTSRWQGMGMKVLGFMTPTFQSIICNAVTFMKVQLRSRLFFFNGLILSKYLSNCIQKFFQEKNYEWRQIGSF